MKIALTIAGSDSGGGAGIQADLAAFHHFGVWGTSAITCITAQNPHEVARVAPLPPALVIEQAMVASRAQPPDAIKIGMIYSAPIVAAVADLLPALTSRTPVVIDPVLCSTSGAPLLEPAAEQLLREKLLPLATVITPNLAEARVLAGLERVDDPATMEHAAQRISGETGAAVLIKGGHLAGAPIDLLWDSGRLIRFTATRVDVPTAHGTGCALSAALAANLALGHDLAHAVRSSKTYLSDRLRLFVASGRGSGSLPGGCPW